MLEGHSSRAIGEALKISGESVRVHVQSSPVSLTLLEGVTDVVRNVEGQMQLDVTVRGPMAIALPDATMFVATGWSARALPIGGWLVEQDA